LNIKPAIKYYLDFLVGFGAVFVDLAGAFFFELAIGTLLPRLPQLCVVVVLR